MKSALENSWLFSNLASDELHSIDKLSQLVKMKKGDQVLSEGKPNDALWIVASGQVSVRKQKLAGPLAQLSAGDMFGEMSWLDGWPASSSIIVDSSECELVKVPFVALDNFLSDATELHVQILRRFAINLSHRLR